jgi:hypothetical protein
MGAIELNPGRAGFAFMCEERRAGKEQQRRLPLGCFKVFNRQ